MFGSGLGYAIPVEGHIRSLLKYLGLLVSKSITIKILLPVYKAVFIVSSNLEKDTTENFLNKFLNSDL